MHDAQLTATAILGEVFSGRRLDTALAAAWTKLPTLPPQQRALTQDLCYGVLRHLGALDTILDALLAKVLNDERLRQLLRIALYQLEHTRAAPYAVVDHAVQACDKLNAGAAKGLVNAVLRNFLRRRAILRSATTRSDISRYSHPQWWVDKLRLQYPLDYTTILEVGNVHAPLTLRVNRRRITREDYLALLVREEVPASVLDDYAIVLQKPLPVDRIPGFREGLVSVQDASAQRAAPLLDVIANTRVLDACAAPGGKTAHILELADVNLIALDNDSQRLSRTDLNLRRLGLSAHLQCGDALNPGEWWNGQLFDRILADLPCSASGVVRRHPDIKWRRRAEDIVRFADQQARMLEALWRLLARGGKLLYATCSVFREENQLLVDQFLSCYADAARVELAGVGTNIDKTGQILPDTLHDGFYYALLQKI
jgi:16S rRNA (cytosine967-C5)-methyltransferase